MEDIIRVQRSITLVWTTQNWNLIKHWSAEVEKFGEKLIKHLGQPAIYLQSLQNHQAVIRATQVRCHSKFFI
jgi:hypothetical protein